MSKKIQEKSKPTPKLQPSSKVNLSFGRMNYILTILAFVVVLIGFFLMYGDKEDIYSFRRITLAPIVVISGFVIGVFAIMFKSGSTHGAD